MRYFQVKNISKYADGSNSIASVTCIFIIFLLLPRNADAQFWNQLTTTNDPSPRANSSAIFDPVGQRMIVFGGKTASGNVNEVWSLDLISNNWQNITPDTGSMPAPRFSQNAMYDSAFHQMIIWSGQGAELYNDVWAFDLSDHTWQELSPDGNVDGVPLKRYGTAAVFDPPTRRLVNFAGFTTSGRFEDTWYFHLDSMKWVDRTVPLHPFKRCLHSACYVDDQQMMIVYGGQGGPSDSFLDDLWSLNLQTYEWTDLTPLSRPSARRFPSCTYIGQNNIVVYGGQASSGFSGELWHFNLSANSWDSIPQGSPRPLGRSSHTAIYIPSTQKIILFGGTDGSYMNDTWEFSFSYQYTVDNGWNLVSLPLTVSDSRKNSLFSSSTSNAFAYQSGYVQKDTLKNGDGYWLKFESSQTVTMRGFPRIVDTVDVIIGWNLIGSISTSVDVNNVVSDPPDIITSQFFGYSTVSGYSATNTLEPSKAYWVKVNQNGKLIVDGNLKE